MDGRERLALRVRDELPRGRFAETGYDYGPWHYRYVGRDLAAQIVASGLTQREYLWLSQR